MKQLKDHELPPIEAEAQQRRSEQPREAMPQASSPQTKPAPAPAPAIEKHFKTEWTKDEYITCENVGSPVLRKSFRYKNEKACQGSWENKPVKQIKPRASSSNSKT